MMDYTTCVQEFNRMCATFHSCCECIYRTKLKRLFLSEDGLGDLADLERECAQLRIYYPRETETITEEWAKNHPRKTMLETFIDSKPGSIQTPDGTFRLCPHHVNPMWMNLCTDGKGNCRECWGREAQI